MLMCMDYRNYRTEFSSVASKPFIAIMGKNFGARHFKILISLKLCRLTCMPPFQFWPYHINALDKYTLNFYHVRLICLLSFGVGFFVIFVCLFVF